LIVDLHSHILPAMDDGSKSADESIKMLYISAEQGVSAMVATPHFYPENEPPESFLERRRVSASMLVDSINRFNKINRGTPDGAKIKLPEIYIGAEVAFFTGIERCSQIKNLCIKGTDFLLLEMPVEKWSDRVMDEVYSIKERCGCTPILAHIERYIGLQRRGMLNEIISHGILIQSNASFFTGQWTRNKAVRMLCAGGIDLLGTDCHNCTSRPPCMGAALQFIHKKAGKKPLDELIGLSRFIIKNALPITAQDYSEIF